ncbi:ATP-dependent DNA ligase [Nocardioides sp. Bht2]|uniref:ATP-dependent DNA ligase n=1 Tax=Nocardioides sp. Bht2 TaxID=3392297 RepID=UPI0039B4228A
MRLQMIVEAWEAVRATRSRLAKRAALAAILAEAGESIELAASYLAGELQQRRTGVGWATLRDLPPASTSATLSVAEVDAAFQEMAELAGPGSAGRRTALVSELFGRATEPEQAFLRGLITGELRQGALDAVLLDAIAEAAALDVALVRRAAMLGGSIPAVARAAFRGGAEALEEFSLKIGRAVRPMLAGSAPDVLSGWESIDGGSATGAVGVDTKLDGVRVQVHRRGEQVWIFTRSLDDVTDRMPGVVAQALTLPCDTVVLDGEALLIGGDGRPRPFQETASRSATRSGEEELQAFFFDLLHRDGVDLIDAPFAQRRDALVELAPRMVTDYRAPGQVTEAEAFFVDAVAAGYEGVILKALDAPYAAGRRGAGWVKVKPRHTLDLVVLAVERGSGRRRGWLSNIHLGARNPDGTFTMLGKTFKGMTDEMLAWQTERFRELEVADDGYVVTLRPEQVVEIAFDGVQRSSRYPGGVALRFARVLRYRDDKNAAAADSLASVQALLV